MMNTFNLAMLGWPEIVAILALALLMFGAKKLPELARGLGKGIKEFKKATQDVQDDLHRALDDDQDYRPPSRPAAPPAAADQPKPAPAPDAPPVKE